MVFLGLGNIKIRRAVLKKSLLLVKSKRSISKGLLPKRNQIVNRTFTDLHEYLYDFLVESALMLLKFKAGTKTKNPWSYISCKFSILFAQLSVLIKVEVNNNWLCQ